MKRLLFVLLSLALVSSFTWAQKADADIYGTVLLPDGSAIPGVLVGLTGSVIGKMTTVSSEEGNFRFVKLPPGLYELKFELEGFKTVIRKGIRMYAGKNITLNIPMETTTIKEEIVITEKAGAIDTRKTTVGVNVTKEMIESLPTARNPWTIMNLIPGMMMDREDVGGNESGQQSYFYGHGGDNDDNVWTIDGANVTDPSALGAAPAYLNINAYEELQVTLGSNDITAQSGGVQLNFVTKRAGNRISGDFHLYIEDKAWQMTQDLPTSITDRGWGSPGIDRLYQYGVNLGGPIVKDKLWWFGSWAVQDIHAVTITQGEDATWLVSAYGKINFQFGNTSGDFHMAYDSKLKWGRASGTFGAANMSQGALWDQTGPGYVYSGQLQHVFGNLMLNAKFAYTDGGFALYPKGGIDGTDNILVGPDAWIQGWDYASGSYLYYGTDRNTLNLSLDGNYFAEGVLGGDHEIRFGVDFYNADTTSTTAWPNQRVLWSDYVGGPYTEAWFVTDGPFDVNFKRISFYLSDTATFGKLTANVGIRYDKESGAHNATTAPGITLQETGTPIFADYLGPLSIPETKIDAAYEVISPRVSLTYDISGDGKNVVKASFARYGSLSGNSISGHTWVLGTREIDVPWTDTNGNGVPDIGEFSEDPSNWYWWNINEDDPYNTSSRNIYDPDLNSPIMTELSLSFEKGLGEDMALQLRGVYKKTGNQIWYRGLLSDGSWETPANYYAAGDLVFPDGSSKTWYYRYERPSGSVMSNHGKDWYNQYMALDVIFSKKLSGKWMMDASFSIMDFKAVRDKNEWIDPTNYDFFADAVVAPTSSGSGISGVFVNARWQFKMSGLYQLPWGINFTGVLIAREGYVAPYRIQAWRPNGISWQWIYKPDSKMGDDRLPTFWMLNLGVEKTLRISDTATATIFIDGYNVTNNTTTLSVRTTMGSAQDDILRILNPGVFQFGVRVNF